MKPFNSKLTLLDFAYCGKTKNIVSKIANNDAIEIGISKAAFSGVIKFLLLIELFSIFFKILNLLNNPYDPSLIKYFSLISLYLVETLVFISTK